MNNFDLWPTEVQPRAILAALAVLQQAGTDAHLNVNPGTDLPYSISFGLCSTAEGREALRQSVRAVLEYQHQSLTAGLVIIQAKGARKPATPGSTPTQQP